MEEIWKPVVGYEGLYEVSNLGRVRSVDRVVAFRRHIDSGQTQYRKSKLLSIKKETNGYYRVTLFKDGKRKMFGVHRLVAQAFIPNPDNLPIINHKDETPSNNVVTNLEWCTVKYNANYGTCKDRRQKTRIEKGYIDPTHIGLSLKEQVRLRQRKYRAKKKKESIL